MLNILSVWAKSKIEILCKKLEKNILSNKYLKCRVVYGPVRSRRLGLVLGINNVKSKVCSYNCIYCPIGKTSCCSICSNNCLSPFELFVSVKNKIEEIKSNGKKIDYILFYGAGDPALDSNLSQEISILREFNYPIVVFTNSAMLWNENIQENLMYADYVSLKVDTFDEETWLKINRPHQRLRYNLILNGIEEFSKKFNGILTTETMLIKNVNDNENEIRQLATFLNKINRSTSYFMTPIYPTRKSFAVAPDEEKLLHLSELIKDIIPDSKLLCCPQTEEFIATDDFETELLGLLELHPITEEAVKTFAYSNDKINQLNEMISKNLLVEFIFKNKKYFKLAETKSGIL